mmetsp:Transcript_9350/g.34302  ORF Transcript_9350/g.34302 Transcript_9350/m.34302 type:complete len:490 (-) Transcript_9350:247-1716(-)
MASCDPTTLSQVSEYLNTLNPTLDASPLLSVLCPAEGFQGRHLQEAPDAAQVAADVDVQFLLTSGYLVFIMQAGFAMLEAGSVRAKNTINVLLKNVLDACVGAIFWYLLGWGFAYGEDAGGFIGSNDFALSVTNDFPNWFFQWTFAATTATIVSGAVAERTKFVAYLAYSIFLVSFVYPVVVHWVWSSDGGWLSAFDASPINDVGMVDYAGSAVVHMTGGWAGLCGAFFVGPRLGRFDENGDPVPIKGHSVTLQVLGTFFLWYGWYGFNPGSALAVVTYSTQIARTAVTTTMGAAAGGVTVLCITYFRTGHYDLSASLNGVLAGLVSITAGCPVIEPWSALLAGFVGGFVFLGWSKLMLALRIDDPLDAVAVHGACGAWGAFYVGLMARQDYLLTAYGIENNGGLFQEGKGDLLGTAVLGIVVISAWTLGLMGTFFFLLKTIGALRIPPEEEEMGLDVSHHGGHAYETEDTKVEVPDPEGPADPETDKA